MKKPKPNSNNNKPKNTYLFVCTKEENFKDHLKKKSQKCSSIFLTSVVTSQSGGLFTDQDDFHQKQHEQHNEKKICEPLSSAAIRLFSSTLQCTLSFPGISCGSDMVPDENSPHSYASSSNLQPLPLYITL